MTTVQILGIDGSPDTKKMRVNVKLALAALGIKTIVENVTKVEELVKYKINGIPALVVNNTVVLQKRVPEIEDLKAMLKVFIEPSKNQFNMKKLIVPTDFSSTAENAFKYALNLAEIQHATVRAVNIFSPEFDPQNPYLTEPVKLMEETAHQQMEDFVTKATYQQPTQATVVIEKESIIGFPAEEIIRLSCEDSPDMIVMGSTGEKGFFEKIFGSISVAVSQNADCPVLLVPEAATYNGFRQILYASDFENLSENTLKKLVEIAATFKAGIHFVHVDSGNSKQDFKEIENSLFKVLFGNGEPTFSFTMSKVQGISVSEGLNTYADAHDVDLLVLVHPHRDFWDSIFRKSVTKEMAFNPKLPILVLHE